MWVNPPQTNMQVEEVREWAARNMAQASSADTGASLEDCEALQKKFFAFAASVRASSHVVGTAVDMARGLIAKGHSGEWVGVGVSVGGSVVWWVVGM